MGNNKVTCPICGGQQATQISAQEFQCNYCGSVFSATSSVMNAPTYGIPLQSEKPQGNICIYGYTQTYSINPKVKIHVNGTLVGEVGREEVFYLNLSAPCQLMFKCSFRSTTINIDPQVNSNIWLSFNDFSGSLQAKLDAPVVVEEREMTAEELANDNQPWSQLFITVCFPIYAILGIIFCLLEGRKKAAMQELAAGVVGMIFWFAIIMANE